MSDALVYPFAERPAYGAVMPVAPGIYWLRMPVPIPGLESINLWVLEDGPGLTLVDTGVATAEVTALWEQVIAEHFGGRPVTRVLCTHFHPDHLGQAGWLTRRFGVDLWMTLGEWSFGRMLSLESETDVPDEVLGFYRRIGFDAAAIERYRVRGFDSFRRAVSEIPRSLRRIADGETIAIGDHAWQVIVGQGHSPEHAALYCAELNLLISGDQVLPRISPHIGVYPGEPEADPLSLYLTSLDRFRPLPAQTLVLPSHNEPFHGLHARLDALAQHHHKRLSDLFQACATPRTALDVLPVLFHRKLDEKNTYFAVSEGIAHLHRLMVEGRLLRELGADGVYRYRQSCTQAASAA